MKISGLAIKGENGRLQRARAPCILSLGLSQVRHLSEEQKEAIKACTTSSEIDPQAPINLNRFKLV